jgi:hypothetical protein
VPVPQESGEADWQPRDESDDFYDELWDEEFDPDWSPPRDEEERLAALAAPVAPPRVPDALAAGFTHRDPEASGIGFASGGVLDELTPGQVLAGFTTEATESGHDRLTDDELIGVLCAWRRLASWAAAGEVRAINELVRRRQEQARALNNGHLIDHVGDEVAAAMTLTGRSADRLLDLCTELKRLGGCLAALAEGMIDWPRAVVFADELAALDDADAAVVEAKILPRAGGLTTGQLRAALRRAVLSVDPEAASRRRREGRKDARVQTWEETSGNGALAGRDLPPAEVVAADQRLTALARWLKEQGAHGTQSQLRAAVFMAVLAGRPVHTLLPGPAGGGHGSSGPAGGGPGGGGPGDAGPGGGPGGAGPGGGPGGAGSTGGDLAGDSWPDLALVPPGVSGSVNLTMPLSAWLGRSEVAGDVAGFGPLDADSCRDLARVLAAGPDSRWHLTITGPGDRAVAHACARAGPGPPGSDPGPWLSRLKISGLASGACTHQRETMGYRPSRSLRHLIEIRQRTCGYPGCRRPAARCDCDHTIPYDQGGRTCECNVAPVCRRHHQAKGLPGWQLSQDEPGVLTWIPPHGRVYVTKPSSYPV